MNLIDDNFISSILETEQYHFPLKNYKHKIKLQLARLTLEALAYVVLFSLVYLAINNSSYIDNKNQKNLLSIYILIPVTILFIKGLKQAHSLSRELFEDRVEIKKDFVVDTSILISREEDKSIHSSSVLFKYNGLVELLNSSENYNYYLKRKKYNLKPKKKYNATIAIPYKAASTLFKKLEESPKKRQVLLVETINTKQLLTVLFLDEINKNK